MDRQEQFGGHWQEQVVDVYYSLVLSSKRSRLIQCALPSSITIRSASLSSTGHHPEALGSLQA